MTKSLVRIVVAALCVGAGLAAILSGVVGSAPASAKANADHDSRARTLQVGSPSLGDKPDDFDSSGDFWGRFTNLTPYTLTYVTRGGNPPPDGSWFNNGNGEIPDTVKPGQTFAWELRYYSAQGCSTCIDKQYVYSGFLTYRADVVGATTPEYVTMGVSGCNCTGTYHGSIRDISVQVFNTDAPPAPPNPYTGTGYDPINDLNVSSPPGTHNTTGAQIHWTQSGTGGNNVLFQVDGDFSVNAAKDPPALVDILNSMCGGTLPSTMCSFTSTGPLTWGTGDRTLQATHASCVISGTPEVSGTSQPPPENDPDWQEVSVEASRTASISVGGSITASTEVNLLDIISAEVSVKFGAEHEWANTSTFEKTTRIYVPDNYIGKVWIAPVVGKVTGTLVVTSFFPGAFAKYTITNFSETRSGAAKSLTTPAFDILTDARPLTADERAQFCPAAADSRGSLRLAAVRSR